MQTQACTLLAPAKFLLAVVAYTSWPDGSKFGDQSRRAAQSKLAFQPALWALYWFWIVQMSNCKPGTQGPGDAMTTCIIVSPPASSRHPHTCAVTLFPMRIWSWPQKLLHSEPYQAGRGAHFALFNVYRQYVLTPHPLAEMVENHHSTMSGQCNTLPWLSYAPAFVLTQEPVEPVWKLVLAQPGQILTLSQPIQVGLRQVGESGGRAFWRWGGGFLDRGRAEQGQIQHRRGAWSVIAAYG